MRGQPADVVGVQVDVQAAGGGLHDALELQVRVAGRREEGGELPSLTPRRRDVVARHPRPERLPLLGRLLGGVEEGGDPPDAGHPSPSGTQSLPHDVVQSFMLWQLKLQTLPHTPPQWTRSWHD